jgi:hypothetical protein
VRQGQINRLIETDQRRILPTPHAHEHQEQHPGRGECPKVPGAHKD